VKAGEYGVGVPEGREDCWNMSSVQVNRFKVVWGVIAIEGGQNKFGYIMKDRPQAEATASMMRARLLLMTCLAMSLDAERIVVVRNCNNSGRTGSTTSGLTTPATKPTLSQTASLASTALIDGSHVRTWARVV
jgi:hypothetical protein